MVPHVRSLEPCRNHGKLECPMIDDRSLHVTVETDVKGLIVASREVSALRALELLQNFC